MDYCEDSKRLSYKEKQIFGCVDFLFERYEMNDRGKFNPIKDYLNNGRDFLKKVIEWYASREKIKIDKNDIPSFCEEVLTYVMIQDAVRQNNLDVAAKEKERELEKRIGAFFGLMPWRNSRSRRITPKMKREFLAHEGGLLNDD